MTGIDFRVEELEELTAAIREGAGAIVKAWDVLGKIGARIGCDWEPDGQSVSDIMELFAVDMTDAESITTDAVKQVFSRSQDWEEVSGS